jgi:hypothetical protein
MASNVGYHQILGDRSDQLTPYRSLFGKLRYLVGRKIAMDYVNRQNGRVPLPLPSVIYKGQDSALPIDSRIPSSPFIFDILFY